MKLTQTIKQASLVLASISIISLTAVAADEKVNADNTLKNQRDRSGETNTSGDQSNSSADLKTTPFVRR
jgi:hyperosmotically inducible periplasmic protein